MPGIDFKAEASPMEKDGGVDDQPRGLGNNLQRGTESKRLAGKKHKRRANSRDKWWPGMESNPRYGDFPKHTREMNVFNKNSHLTRLRLYCIRFQRQ